MNLSLTLTSQPKEHSHPNHENLTASDRYRIIRLTRNADVNERLIIENIRPGDVAKLEHVSSGFSVELKVDTVQDATLSGFIIAKGEVTKQMRSIFIRELRTLCVKNEAKEEKPFDHNYLEVELPDNESRYGFLREALRRDDMLIINYEWPRHGKSPTPGQTIGRFCYVVEPNKGTDEPMWGMHGKLYISTQSSVQAIYLHTIKSIKVSPDTLDKIAERNPMLHARLLRQAQEQSLLEPRELLVALCKGRAALLKETLEADRHE